MEPIKDRSCLTQISKDLGYYVYRLIDPRNMQTFYVGKGCGDRAYQHAKNVKSLIAKEKDEDSFSLKEKIISDIIASGKEVVVLVHRWGLTANEALEVESALIDAYPGLANIQKGHGIDKGCILAIDLCEMLNAKEYNEPPDNYIIIKIKREVISAKGSLYAAVREAWKADINKASNYMYVFAVVDGIVREVYKVGRWYQIGDRIAFDGVPAKGNITIVKGCRIPAKYRKKGAANPFMYKYLLKEEDNLSLLCKSAAESGTNKCVSYE